jgi:mRNA-degrading endonuclease RelE of RelBE toxin-antitoxin system
MYLTALLISSAIFFIMAKPAVLADLYKCTDTSGQVGFTDKPCANSTSNPNTDNQYIPKSSITSFKELDIKQHKAKKPVKKKRKKSCAFFSSTQLRHLRIKQSYKEGLPASEIVKRFGKPTKIEQTGDNKERWKYKETNYRLIFNFKDLCLTSWKEKWFGKKSKINKYRKN